MNRAAVGLAALAVAIGFSASCGGSISTNENSDGGSGATSSSSSGSGSGSSSGSNSSSGGACGAQGEPCCNGAACDNGLMCGGGVCFVPSGNSSGSGGSSGGDSDGGSGGSSGGPGEGGSDLDVTLPPLDAALASLDAALPGLAGFGFIVNDVVQYPMACPSEDWEFPWPPGEGMPTPFPPPAGIKSVLIVNTGTLPMPYLAQSGWNLGTHYVPGVLPGGSDQLAGVLDPGAVVDITSVYVSGAVAILGSAEPFSEPDAGKYVSDEGTIPWPAGVPGSGGAATMYIAEIEVPSSPPSSCTAAFQAW